MSYDIKDYSNDVAHIKEEWHNVSDMYDWKEYVTYMKKQYDIPESYKIVKPKSAESISAELRQRRNFILESMGNRRGKTTPNNTNRTRRKGGKRKNDGKKRRNNASRKKK